MPLTKNIRSLTMIEEPKTTEPKATGAGTGQANATRLNSSDIDR